MLFDLEIKIIRKALKKLAPSLTVRRDRGTAYSWIVIRGSGRFGAFTETEIQALAAFGLNYGANSAVISPENRRYYEEKAVSIFGIELPEPIKKEYQERDNYKEELAIVAKVREITYKSCQHEWVRKFAIIFPSNYKLYKCRKCGLEEMRE